MALSCNIDRKGRIARLICGMVTVAAAGGMVALWAWPSGSWKAWAASGAVFVLGAFQIAQYWLRWCPTRALGIRTPM